jgi:hypothetical protein
MNVKDNKTLIESSKFSEYDLVDTLLDKNYLRFLKASEVSSEYKHSFIIHYIFVEFGIRKTIYDSEIKK